MLRRANSFSKGSVELVDMHGSLQLFKKRHGLASWKVLVEKKKDGKINPKDDYQNFKTEDLFQELRSFEQAQATHPFLKSSLI